MARRMTLPSPVPPPARAADLGGPAAGTAQENVAALRRFNRFHTRLVGALDESLLASGLTLPQSRLIYEIAQAPQGQPATAAQLGRELGMDAGYLSRLIATLESAGLVIRKPVAGNAKRLALSLTAVGRAQYRRLDRASARQAAALLQSLPPPDQSRLIGTLAQAQALLGDATAATAAPVTLREPVPGDLGFIVHRQAALYAHEYGWDIGFEALLAQIVADFVHRFVPGFERCWVAERQGQIVGSVFVMRKDHDTAQLRMLYVEPTARGLGLGRRLVDECLAFARSAGYGRMVLWTNDILVAARHIYESTGFELLETEHHRSFGKDLVGQTWGRTL
jgi:DNA-binding MarR family transcriptional regulator/GNAT superfamily N-acetyltransferase